MTTSAETLIRKQIRSENDHVKCLRSMLPCSWICPIQKIFVERRRVYREDTELSGPDYDRQLQRAESGYPDA